MLPPSLVNERGYDCLSTTISVALRKLGHFADLVNEDSDAVELEKAKIKRHGGDEVGFVVGAGRTALVEVELEAEGRAFGVTDAA